VETSLQKHNLLPEKQKCFLSNLETFHVSQVQFLLRKHCFLVFAHLGKHGETLAGNNVSATMFPSLPKALICNKTPGLKFFPMLFCYQPTMFMKKAFAFLLKLYMTCLYVCFLLVFESFRVRVHFNFSIVVNLVSIHSHTNLELVCMQHWNFNEFNFTSDEKNSVLKTSLDLGYCLSHPDLAAGK
jgi:hypothetical protein